ncbi:hypothetical protein EYF80_017374 [Liparis tanakae]|uniref:Uncharacterized protein n=1 Tax=Liparis tanakae TaxID=230148 RepID=A0A4Z2I3D3_9TELE|nr:hypothetical protein EYF80_017374 [Liparis tanakae]
MTSLATVAMQCIHRKATSRGQRGIQRAQAVWCGRWLFSVKDFILTLVFEALSRESLRVPKLEAVVSHTPKLNMRICKAMGNNRSRSLCTLHSPTLAGQKWESLPVNR